MDTSWQNTSGERLFHVVSVRHGGWHEQGQGETVCGNYSLVSFIPKKAMKI